VRRLATAALAVCFVPFLSAQAQQKSSVDLRATFGMRNAIIEGTCSGSEWQAMGGASLRYHVTSRVSLGPEVLYVGSCSRQTFTFNHPQVSGLLHAAVDLNESSRVRPYLIGGGGFVRHKDSFGRSRYGAEFVGGAGAKIFLSDRVFVAPEVQTGPRVWFVRVTGSLGFVLGP
jgi:opacity protein-like surface antigen